MTELAGALERVANLYTGGHITESEFVSAKAAILGAPPVPSTSNATEACLVALTGIAKDLVHRQLPWGAS